MATGTRELHGHLFTQGINQVYLMIIKVIYNHIYMYIIHHLTTVYSTYTHFVCYEHNIIKLVTWK